MAALRLSHWTEIQGAVRVRACRQVTVGFRSLTSSPRPPPRLDLDCCKCCLDWMHFNTVAWSIHCAFQSKQAQLHQILLACNHSKNREQNTSLSSSMLSAGPPSCLARGCSAPAENRPALVPKTLELKTWLAQPQRLKPPPPRSAEPVGSIGRSTITASTMEIAAIVCRAWLGAVTVSCRYITPFPIQLQK